MKKMCVLSIAMLISGFVSVNAAATITTITKTITNNLKVRIGYIIYHPTIDQGSGQCKGSQDTGTIEGGKTVTVSVSSCAQPASDVQIYSKSVGPEWPKKSPFPHTATIPIADFLANSKFTIAGTNETPTVKSSK
jgi:hypothetical protein